ncbi:MAG: MFS transporter [Thermoplasmata archaeon]|nr:MAG: MFS transporter [Thermoplasmata archaeon]
MGGSYRRVLQLQVANLFAETFAFNFIYLHAHNAGHSEVAIATFFTLMFGWAAVAVVVVMRPTKVGPSMALGMVLRALSLLAALRLAWFGNLVLAAVLHGTFIVVFWIPYNVVFMRMTTDSDRAGRSTQLFALFAVAGAVFPFIAGYLMDWRGFPAAVACAWVVLAIGAVLAYRTTWGEPMRFDLRRALAKGRRMVPLVYLEGFWQGVFWVAVWIGTVRMVEQSSEYGTFLAFLGIMAGVASVVAGRWSDRARDRWPPLMISGVGVAVFIIAVPFAEGDLTLWSLLSGMAYFFSYMLMAFTFTCVAEMGLRVEDAMGLREVMFNLGRTSGGGLFIATLLLSVPMVWPMALASVAVLLKVLGFRRVLMDAGED